MQETVKYLSYTEYKNLLDTEMQKAVEGFVTIGYLLEMAEQTDILKESGYDNVNEFARAEYNLDKTQVSRFINIYKRFGEEGNPRLKEQYRGYGVAKLGLMLTLPDVLNEELSPEYSKSEIQAIKDEVEEEKKISDIEMLIEGEDRVQQAMGNLEKTVHQLGKDKPELYVALHKTLKEHGRSAEQLQEQLAPMGEAMYSVRIQGVGRLMLIVKDIGQNVTLTNIRSNEKESYTWEELMDAIEYIMDLAAGPEESWAAVYGEPYPKKPEVAPVQPKQTVPKKPEQKKPEPKKPSRVEKAPKKAEKPVQKEPVQQEEQLPGQMDVNDYPELIPEGMQQAPDTVVQEYEEQDDREKSENAENTVCEAEPVEGEVVEEESEEELHKDALLMAQKIVNILGDYEQLPENMADACVADAEELLLIVSKLSIAVKGRNGQ